MEGRAYSFTIEEKSTGRFLGRISVRREAEPDVWNLGFWTHPREQGRGYMSEAAQRVVTFGFEELDAVRIEARHAVWNKASERVLRKLGMILLENLPHGFQKRGQWVAENRFGITRSAWETGRE